MMATDFEIQRLTRHCLVTGRALQPGERYYSLLLDKNGEIVREDYGSESWSGPSSGYVAFWSGRVPAADAPKRSQYNEPLLVDCFQRLAGQNEPDKLAFRYVVALMLMRKKRLKFEDIRHSSDGSSTMVVRDSKTGTRYEFADPRLNDDQISRVQADVFRVLGWDD